MSTSPESRRKCHYMKGDSVIVVKGDLINLRGWVDKVEDDNLHIKPNRKDLHATVVVNAKYVCKYFKAGDHVKVVSGAHEGATGTVIKANCNVLTIVSATTREDMSVFADNVVDSSEVTSGATTKVGDYELHDRVMLGDTSFEVVKLREIKYKIEKRSTAIDGYGNLVSVKDVVKIFMGPCKGKQCPVEHIHGGMLFINDRHHTEHSGFICVKAQSCILMGGSNAQVSPFSRCVTSRQGAYIPPPPRRYSTGPPLDSGVRHRGAAGRDNFVGSIVKIRLGNYKGCSGRVVSRNGQLVRVELESQMKTVTVKHEEISVDAGVFTSFTETPRRGIRSETPMHRKLKLFLTKVCNFQFRDRYGKCVRGSISARDKAWDSISAWMNENATPFNTVCSPSFQVMLHSIGDYGKESEASEVAVQGVKLVYRQHGLYTHVKVVVYREEE